MSIIKTEALLLKKINFQDSSHIIHFYTREEGKISVIAKGARQIKSQYRGYLEPLNHLSIIYYEKSTREVQILSKVDLIKNFLPDTNDMKSYYLGLAILESLDKLVHHNEENEKLFDMTINVLHFMDRNPGQSDIGFILFLLGAIKFLGYQIDFQHCQYCGRELQGFYFDEKNPQPLCYHCSNPDFETITGHQLTWLRYIDSLNLLQSFKQIKSVEKSGEIIEFLLLYAGMYFDFYPKLHSLELLKYLK